MCGDVRGAVSLGCHLRVRGRHFGIFFQRDSEILLRNARTPASLPQGNHNQSNLPALIGNTQLFNVRSQNTEILSTLWWPQNIIAEKSLILEALEKRTVKCQESDINIKCRIQRKMTMPGKTEPETSIAPSSALL